MHVQCKVTVVKTRLCEAAQQLFIVCDGRLSQASGLFKVRALLICCSNSYNAVSSQITHIFNWVIRCFSLLLKDTKNWNLKAFINHKISTRRISFWN